MTALCFDLCKKDERFCDGPILKLAAAKSGKKEMQPKEVPSHSLSKHICLLFADLSKVVKENALSGFGVLSRQNILHTYHHDFFSQGNNFAALIQLMPILIIIFMSVFSSFLVSDPLYNLQPTA